MIESNDVEDLSNPLIESLIRAREQKFHAAKAEFFPDDPYANSKLLGAALALIDAYQKERGMRR